MNTYDIQSRTCSHQAAPDATSSRSATVRKVDVRARTIFFSLFETFNVTALFDKYIRTIQFGIESSAPVSTVRMYKANTAFKLHSLLSAKIV
ncbi:hypothetical protein [Desertivirga arenae]|uniref:hypothetical protein n=1 Tax=Desertivirga arenae TaxID=2810309 RepID=UPI001A968729|nr:hypothetical protein [Pedobacter sp. SYSU D00823]